MGVSTATLIHSFNWRPTWILCDADLTRGLALLATIPNVPIFAKPQAGYTQVLMYAWNGEKFLGVWDVGRY